MPTQSKEVHFRLPLAVWELWVQVMPGYGERTAFIRQAVSLAIRTAKWRDEYSGRTTEAIKELLDGTPKQDYRQGSKRSDARRLHSIVSSRATKSPEDTRESKGETDEGNDKEEGNSVWEDEQY